MIELRLPRLAFRIGCAGLALLAGTAVPDASSCNRRDALGTAWVLAVNAALFPRVGLKNFPETLPLADYEVVLTFDDGPRSPNTDKVLAALAQECARATFFLVGRSSAEFPELVRRMAAQGHTVAHHSWSHPMMSKISFEQAKEDIERGIAAVEMGLNGLSTKMPSTPFFRFPYFDATPATLDLLQARGIVVFGADLWASDWENITPEQELTILIERLEAARRGIILLYDAQTRTAAMLPAFLRYLHQNGYRIVHLVPAAAKSAEAPLTSDPHRRRRAIHSQRRTQSLQAPTNPIN